MSKNTSLRVGLAAQRFLGSRRYAARSLPAQQNSLANNAAAMGQQAAGADCEVQQRGGGHEGRRATGVHENVLERRGPSANEIGGVQCEGAALDDAPRTSGLQAVTRPFLVDPVSQLEVPVRVVQVLELSKEQPAVLAVLARRD